MTACISDPWSFSETVPKCTVKHAQAFPDFFLFFFLTARHVLQFIWLCPQNIYLIIYVVVVLYIDKETDFHKVITCFLKDWELIILGKFRPCSLNNFKVYILRAPSCAHNYHKLIYLATKVILDNFKSMHAVYNLKSLHFLSCLAEKNCFL